MSVPVQPLYLFADSQLLFWSDGIKRFLQSIVQPVSVPTSTAAYVGASNDDQPEFFEIFEAAMNDVGIRRCQMIASSFEPSHRDALESADIIVLSGGDVEAGWKTIQETGMKDVLINRYHAGAIIVGISAGAIQLGRYHVVEKQDCSLELIDTIGLVPFIVSTHEEKRGWEPLVSVIELLEGTASGIALSTGGGAAYHTDGSFEAIRYPAEIFNMQEKQVRRAVLFPQNGLTITQ